MGLAAARMIGIAGTRRHQIASARSSCPDGIRGQRPHGLRLAFDGFDVAQAGGRDRLRADGVAFAAPLALAYDRVAGTSAHAFARANGVAHAFAGIVVVVFTSAQHGHHRAGTHDGHRALDEGAPIQTAAAGHRKLRHAEHLRRFFGSFIFFHALILQFYSRLEQSD